MKKDMILYCLYSREDVEVEASVKDTELLPLEMDGGNAISFDSR